MKTRFHDFPWRFSGLVRELPRRVSSSLTLMHKSSPSEKSPVQKLPDAHVGGVLSCTGGFWILVRSNLFSTCPSRMPSYFTTGLAFLCAA